MKDDNWLLFHLPELLEKIDRTGVAFQEFLRTPSLACAVYHLPAGSKDMQTAHEEDELYFVLDGRARLKLGDDQHPVQTGTLMYVRAACDHTFFDIEEDLTVLAFFGTVAGRTYI